MNYVNSPVTLFPLVPLCLLAVALGADSGGVATGAYIEGTTTTVTHPTVTFSEWRRQTSTAAHSPRQVKLVVRPSAPAASGCCSSSPLVHAPGQCTWLRLWVIVPLSLFASASRAGILCPKKGRVQTMTHPYLNKYENKSKLTCKCTGTYMAELKAESPKSLKATFKGKWV